MKSKYFFCIFIGLFQLMYSTGQCFQLNLVPGANIQPQNFSLSGIKIGLGLEFIPEFDEKFFFTIQNDFFFSRKGTVSQEMYSFQTSAPSGVYNNLTFDLRHFGGSFGISRYFSGNPYDSAGFYFGVGLKLDAFTVKDMVYETYDDSLYYFNEFYSHDPGDVGYAFDNNDWQSFGMYISAGYLKRIGIFSFRPSVNLGTYFTHEDAYIDVKKSRFFGGLDLVIGYIFERKFNKSRYKIL